VSSKPLEEPSPTGFWRGPWKWLIPVIPIFVIGLVLALIGVMKSSEPYKLALEALGRDARAVELLGTPIEDGFMPRGSVQTSSSGDGSAELGIPVSGPRGKGTLYIRASRDRGQWSVEVLLLQVGAERVDLLGEGLE
jgi:hypothetical protein